MILLSIIIPCYNPPEQWDETVLTAYKEIIHQIGFEPELILVNDGSKTDISKGLENLKNNISHFQSLELFINKGKGAALRMGVEAAQGKWTIYTDINFPYTTESFIEIFESLKSGTDVAIAIKDKNYYKQLSPFRTFASKWLSKNIDLFFSMPISDTQCGLKGFNKVGKKIFLNTSINRYMFDLEFVYSVYKKEKQMKIQAIEAHLRPNLNFNKIGLKVILTESWNFLRVIFKS